MYGDLEVNVRDMTCSVSSRFLSQVLSVDGFLQQLSEYFPSYDVALIQAWLTSSILVPQSPLRLR